MIDAAAAINERAHGLGAPSNAVGADFVRPVTPENFQKFSAAHKICRPIDAGG